MSGQPFWRVNLPYIVIGLLDVFAIGLGMGVPVFAVLYGVAVGWWLIRRGPGALPGAVPAPVGPDVPRISLRGLVGQSMALAAVSFVVLLAVWGPSIPLVFDPGSDAAGLGIPLVFGPPHTSLAVWLVLMAIVAPLAQFGAAVTGGVLALLSPKGA